MKHPDQKPLHKCPGECQHLCQWLSVLWLERCLCLVTFVHSSVSREACRYVMDFIVTDIWLSQLCDTPLQWCCMIVFYHQIGLGGTSLQYPGQLGGILCTSLQYLGKLGILCASLQYPGKLGILCASLQYPGKPGEGGRGMLVDCRMSREILPYLNCNDTCISGD